MPCYYCAHFMKDLDQPPPEGSRSPLVSVSAATGHCALSPSWIAVTGLHHCSQLKFSDSSVPGQFWRRMHENHDETKALLAERKMLRDKLKAAQARVRDLKRGQTKGKGKT